MSAEFEEHDVAKAREKHNQSEAAKRYSNEYNKEKLVKLLATNSCPVCNKPKDSFNYRCKKCTKENECCSDKLCIDCSLPICFGFSRCLEHAKIQAIQRDATKEKYINSKLCFQCCNNTPIVENSLLCTKCIKGRLNNLTKIAERSKGSLCIRCGNERNDKYKTCIKCREERKLNKKNKRLENKQVGICTKCHRAALQSCTICELCYLKNLACAYGLTSSGWTTLKEKLEAQNGKCYYSGEKLILGVNSSLDHIIPISRGGKSNIDNLQWVARKVNTMKLDMLESEFIELLYTIIKNIEEK